MPPKRSVPCVLTIAGSDSGGGAGVQADLKAIARCGAHGACVITAITAQNTIGVTAVHPVPAEVIRAQAQAVIEDLGVDAVKVGMLGTAATATAVAGVLGELPAGVPIVVDPVMFAESGARLLDADARRILITEILPRATAATPNVAEAAALLGLENDPSATTGTDSDERVGTLAKQVRSLGPSFVIVTGGHRRQVTDVFCAGEGLELIDGDRYPDGGAHGSGCTHSSALAAALAHGLEPLDAARLARDVAAQAVRDGLREMGRGAGPVDAIGVGRLGPCSGAAPVHLP